MHAVNSFILLKIIYLSKIERPGARTETLFARTFATTPLQLERFYARANRAASIPSSAHHKTLAAFSAASRARLAASELSPTTFAS